MRDLAQAYRCAHGEAGLLDLKELRLLPQPLYRYEPNDGDSPMVDGAVFGYVWTIGTDPEVLLVVEARRAGG